MGLNGGGPVEFVRCEVNQGSVGEDVGWDGS